MAQVNFIMATILWLLALVIIDHWYQEVRADD